MKRRDFVELKLKRSKFKKCLGGREKILELWFKKFINGEEKGKNG